MCSQGIIKAIITFVIILSLGCAINMMITKEQQTMFVLYTCVVIAATTVECYSGNWHFCLRIFAVCKDSYVVYACGFDRNRKWEWFCKSKWRCKNDAAKMTSQALTTLSPWQTAVVLRASIYYESHINHRYDACAPHHPPESVHPNWQKYAKM